MRRVYGHLRTCRSGLARGSQQQQMKWINMWWCIKCAIRIRIRFSAITADTSQQRAINGTTRGSTISLFYWTQKKNGKSREIVQFKWKKKMRRTTTTRIPCLCAMQRIEYVRLYVRKWNERGKNASSVPPPPPSWSSSSFDTKQDLN